MLLEKLFTRITDLDEESIVTTSKSFKALEHDYYASQNGFCEACANIHKCNVRLVLERTDLKQFKDDMLEVLNKTKIEGISPDFGISVVVTGCDAFDKFLKGGIDAQNQNKTDGGKDREEDRSKNKDPGREESEGRGEEERPEADLQ